MHKRRRWKDQLSHWRRLLYAAPFEPLRDLEIDTPAWRFLVEARSAVDALLRASVELEFDKEQLAAEIRRLRGDVCRLQDDNIRFASSLQSIARSGSVAECRELSRRALENDISTSGQISVVNDSRVARQRG